jgi:hypothetical protein
MRQGAPQPAARPRAKLREDLRDVQFVRGLDQSYDSQFSHLTGLLYRLGPLLHGLLTWWMRKVLHELVRQRRQAMLRLSSDLQTSVDKLITH